ncbi:M23 family metallopeptidase [Colwellia sp. 20A7]|jgi:murein DD-endopeptidase MepM/ murein hydrolase activator NlpD|uniref:M23 family metallopeptidase n=1 Tax=Colwellia sp. 20A7 TaxID=2689569 RepID=UPI001358A047|nr:M23 family metallopeptidase [Colwellia sp. 20A7]
MLKKTQQIYKYLFPRRQLLIRQDGEIKYISASARLQFSLVIALGVCLVWLAFSSLEYFTLNDKISLTKNKLGESRNSLNQLSLTYQEKQNALVLKLEQVEKQQKFLQNILDSMSLVLPEKNTSQTSPDIKSSEIINTELKIGSDKPIAKSSQQTDVVLDSIESVKIRLENIINYQVSSRVQLAQQISHRQQTLTNAVLSTGISPDMLLENMTRQAQGGPLGDLTLDTMSAENEGLLNRLVSLLNLEEALSNVPRAFPAKKYYISSRFGIRSDPMMTRPAMHKGIDMAGWPKTKIYSPANGIVRRAGRNGSYGIFIEIDHKNGFTTRYGHLHSTKVKKGQQVDKDDIIGLMGSTGRSTGTHLHYEVIFDKKQINPVKLIRALTDVL